MKGSAKDLMVQEVCKCKVSGIVSMWCIMVGRGAGAFLPRAPVSGEPERAQHIRHRRMLLPPLLLLWWRQRWMF